MDWVRRRWDAFWFEPEAGLNLAAARIAFFGGLLAIYGLRDVSVLGEAGPALWHPVSVFRWLSVPQPGAWMIRATQIVWRLGLLCAALGIRTRLATVVALAGGAFLLGLPQNFGAMRLDDAILVPALCVMAMARCGDRLSVDRWMATRRDAPGRHPLRPSGEYTWPLRLVWVLMAMMYGGSGFAKLRMSGLGWLTSDHVARLLVEHQYGVYPPPVTTWGLDIAASPWLHHGLAAATLGLELAFPIALVSPSARCLLVPAAYLMHVGIRVLLGSSFLGLIAVYAFWVPWERLAATLRAARRPAEEPHRA